jgi:hypothetical protein
MLANLNFVKRKLCQGLYRKKKKTLDSAENALFGD